MTDLHQLVLENACQWDTTSFWLFSGNVFSQLIYYSHTYPAAVCLFLAAIILPVGHKSPVNRAFFVMAVSFALWSLLDFYLWASADIDKELFVWSTLGVVTVALFCSSYFLIYYSITEKYPPFSYVLTAFLLGLPLIIGMPTTYILTGFDYTNCNREAIEGIAFQYMFIIEMLSMLAMAVFVYRERRTILDPEKKRQTLLLAVGVLSFLFLFNLGDIVGSFTSNWTIAQYGLIGMPIMLIFLSYLITKYQAFNIRMTNSVALVLFLMVLMFVGMFV